MVSHVLYLSLSSRIRRPIAKHISGLYKCYTNILCLLGSG